MIRSYYNENAQNMIESTLKLDLHPIYDRFEIYLHKGEKILDVGFGSGRDSIYFRGQGYDVVSIDFAEEVVRRGRTLLNNEVLLVDMREMRYSNEFDAIWASAVLLHYREEEIIEILARMREALKEQGIIYVSFKYGAHVEERHGRMFNDFNEEKFEALMQSVDGLEIAEMWQTQDARKDHETKRWLNVILKKRNA
ncbi:MAG: class I SAM-dependent methyltransferase [Bacillota bacterium]|nr:class I SAM-dependent methyltransferase [Bacillota bacterium]